MNPSIAPDLASLPRHLCHRCAEKRGDYLAMNNLIYRVRGDYVCTQCGQIRSVTSAVDEAAKTPNTGDCLPPPALCRESLWRASL